MKYKLLAFISILLFLTASKCNDDDNTDTEEIKDRKEQYNNVEKDSIMTYMQTHYYEIDAQFNVTLDTIDPAGSHVSLWDDPNLQVLQVNDPEVEDLVYDLYYIPFREGNNQQVGKFDKVLTAYKGWLLNNKVFDETTDNLPRWFALAKVSNQFYAIQAWREVLPHFKDGSYTDNGDGTFTFSGYGAGLLITPSGLAYYQVAKNNLPAYSPLIFSFKTFVTDNDLDNDHVKNEDEDVNDDGSVDDDDTDGNRIRNIYDNDDDGDGVLTKDEDANGDGDPTNDDSDGDGIPDYLDKDTH